MIMQTCAIIVMNFSVRVELTIGMMFVFGMACVGTRSICFLYLMDLMPEKQQILVGTVLNFWDAIVPVLYTLYYWKISKNWLWFVVIFAEAAGLLVIVLTFILPESPRFLVSQKRYEEARKAINFFSLKSNP